MRLRTAATAIAVLASPLPSLAADMAPEQPVSQLFIAGAVERWTGVTFRDFGTNYHKDVDDWAIQSAANGRLSLPLGTNLSIQSDASLEYTEFAFNNDFNPGLDYTYHGAGHLSLRDPGFGLIGAFGGIGTTSSDVNYTSRQDFGFAGGEVQGYFGDFTLYAQGGYIDLFEGYELVDNGFFGRGVARWFVTPDSRFQVEGAYAQFDRDHDFDEINIWQWGARYDFVWSGIPLIDTLPLFVGYRGVYREACDFPTDDGNATDHTLMIGTNFFFGGGGSATLKDQDRYGATLDTPPIGNWLTCSFSGIL